MSDAPNTSPAFIQTNGILGRRIKLTNQVCTRNNPGSTPIIIYDSTSDYAQGNGGLCETIDVQLTGTIPDTVIVLFDKFLDEAVPEWGKVAELAIPATVASNNTQIINYEIPLKKILSPSRADSYHTGLRINSSNVQYGVALLVEVSEPIWVRMYGGEY